MQKKMEVASPFHLHTVINDQIGQKDHGYVTPVTNERHINIEQSTPGENLMPVT